MQRRPAFGGLLAVFCSVLCLVCLGSAPAHGGNEPLSQQPIDTGVQLEPAGPADESPGGHESAGRHVHSVPDESLILGFTSLVDTIAETNESLVSHSQYTERLLVIVVSLLSVLMLVLQTRAERAHARQAAELRANLIELQSAHNALTNETLRLATERLELKSDARTKETVENFLREKFDTKYEAQIAELVNAIAEEVLLMTPSARNSLLARSRRAARELETALREFDPTVAAAAGRCFQGFSEDWHTVGQLFGSDRDELHKGLLAVKANAFPEARGRLCALRDRYKTDVQLFPLIVSSLRALDENGD